MKNFYLTTVRLAALCLLEVVSLDVSNAQQSVFLTAQSSITVTPHAKVYCNSLTWLGEAKVHLQDSATWCVSGNITGADSNSRFFTLGNYAALIRKVGALTAYTFPIGYDQNNDAYRGFTLDMKSLGTSGPRLVSVQLVLNISGTINYEKYFPSNNSCVSNSWVAFNCLSPDGWHCDGPADYEYVVYAHGSDRCGEGMRRMIKTATGSNAWQDSIENVVGNFSSNLCDYSDWTGNAASIPGGTYRNFSDFAIASSTSLLPVMLVDLQADALNQKCIRVSWGTALELNNEKFLVGRGTDGQVFTTMGEVAGSGTTTVPQNYFFDDCAALPNVLYYYQLEQVDYDGATHWSPIVSAEINGEESLERKVFNLLGQEISENAAGIQMVQVITRSGVTCSKTFKPLH